MNANNIHKLTPEDFRDPKVAEAYLNESCRTLLDIGTMMIAKNKGILPYFYGIEFPHYFRGEFYRYKQLGWEIVPICVTYADGKKKIKFPNKWTTRHFTDDDFTENHNGIFIKTGAVSDLMVLDFDMPTEEFNQLDENLIKGALQCKPQVYTPRGTHVYLNNSHVEFWKNRYNLKSLTTVNKTLGVDVREAGSGVIAPKTMIEGYGEYGWVVKPNIYLLRYDPIDLIPLMDAIFKYREANTAIPSVNLKPRYLECSADNWQKAERIVSLLAQLRIDYTDWVKVGMSLYAGFGEQGKYLWDYFLSNPHYHDSQRTIDAHWRSFHSVNRVTLGSLFFIAGKYGVYYE